MSDKHHQDRPQSHKAGTHGKFKHTAKPASFAKVLHAYGLDRDSYHRARSYVFNQLNKEPAHASK